MVNFRLKNSLQTTTGSSTHYVLYKNFEAFAQILWLQVSRIFISESFLFINRKEIFPAKGVWHEKRYIIFSIPIFYEKLFTNANGDYPVSAEMKTFKRLLNTHCFFYKKTTLFCLSLDVLNMMLVIRLRFFKYFS